MVENDNNVEVSSEKEETVGVNFEEARRKILELLAKSDKSDVEKKINDILSEYPLLSGTQVSELYSMVSDYDMKTNPEAEVEGEKPFDRDLGKVQDILNGEYSEDKVKELREVLLDNEITKDERAKLFDAVFSNEKASVFVNGIMDMEYKRIREEHETTIQQGLLKISRGENVDENSSLVEEFYKHRYALMPKLEKYVLPEEREVKQEQSEITPRKRVLGARPTTAEFGEVQPSTAKGLFEKMAESRALKREQKALSKARGWDEVNLDHVKEVDFNKYPHLLTNCVDFTKIDHVILSDPKQNPVINLYGRKLKGKIDLSAYDTVNLSKADLSMVTELDLSHCKNVDLRGVDLSHIKKLKLPQKADGMELDDTKFPPMDELDLGGCKKCFLGNTDMSAVNNFIAPKECYASDGTKFSQHIDASCSYRLNIDNCDLTGVKSIKAPRVSDEYARSQLWMVNCKAPDLKELDVSSCEDLYLGGSSFPNLEKIKVASYTSASEVAMAQAPNLKKIEIPSVYVEREESRDKKMFKTFSNICMAVSLGKGVYKDEETGKMSPITENQRKTVKFIEEHSPKNIYAHGDGIAHVWHEMKGWSGNLSSLHGSLGFGGEQNYIVLTEYNKLIAQGMGLSCYVDMNTCRCVDTPKLKENQSIEFPPITFNSNGSVKDVENHYNRIKGIETPAKTAAPMSRHTGKEGM